LPVNFLTLKAGFMSKTQHQPAAILAPNGGPVLVTGQHGQLATALRALFPLILMESSLSL